MVEGPVLLAVSLEGGLPAGRPSRGELERAAAILHPARRHAFLAGRLALRQLVAELLGLDPLLIRPAYSCPECGPGEHGMPGFALADPADDGGRLLPLPVAASMSRAGGWALLAAAVTPEAAEVGSGAPEAGAGARSGVGVDVALVADFRRAIPDAAFSAAERRRVRKAADPALEAARLWSGKEALLKALGTGLRGDPAAIDALGDPRVQDVDGRTYGLPPGFVAALAVGHDLASELDPESWTGLVGV